MYLDASPDTSGPVRQVEGFDSAASEALIENLQDQVTYLRAQLDIRTEELRESRRLLAGLIERVPELEAPVDSARDERNRPDPGQEGRPEGGRYLANGRG